MSAWVWAVAVWAAYTAGFFTAAILAAAKRADQHERRAP